MTLPTDMTRASKIYDSLLGEIHPGALVTYAEIERAAEEPFGPVVRTAMYTAMTWLEKNRGLAMYVVATIGYQVAEAREVIGLLDKRVEKGKRQIQAGIRQGRRVDIAGLSSPDQLEHMAAVKNMRAMNAELTRLQRRTVVVEERVDDHDSVLEALEQRVRLLERGGASPEPDLGLNR